MQPSFLFRNVVLVGAFKLAAHFAPGQLRETGTNLIFGEQTALAGSPRHQSRPS